MTQTRRSDSCRLRTTVRKGRYTLKGRRRYRPPGEETSVNEEFRFTSDSGREEGREDVIIGLLEGRGGEKEGKKRMSVKFDIM